MLPTATKFSSLFDRRSRAFVRQVIHSGLLDRVQHNVMHEGRRLHISRADGTARTSDLESVEGDVVIPDNELNALDLQRAVELLRDIGEKMRLGSEKHMLDTISDQLPESQKTDASGKKFSAEVFFEALQGLALNFKDDKPLDHLTWVVPPDMMPRIKEVLAEIEGTPKLQARMKALMAKKKAEYREAEARRRLVG